MNSTFPNELDFFVFPTKAGIQGHNYRLPRESGGPGPPYRRVNGLSLSRGWNLNLRLVAR